MPKRVIIRPGGVIEHIHDDAITALTSTLGTVKMSRASDVEPWDELSSSAQSQILSQNPGKTPEDFAGKWFVDVARSAAKMDNPPEITAFGPYDSRADALAFEHDWVENVFFGMTSVPA